MSGTGAKQPVLPTEELWQLRLRDRSLVGRLRMSQLGRELAVAVAIAEVCSCEGLRMPARHEHCHVLVGRRPQASKEGTRGTIRRRRCRAIYGDVSAAGGVPDGDRC